MKHVSDQWRALLCFLINPLEYETEKMMGDFKVHAGQKIFSKAQLAEAFLQYCEANKTGLHKTANAGTWDFKFSVLVGKGLLVKVRTPPNRTTVYYYRKVPEIAEVLERGKF